MMLEAILHYMVTVYIINITRNYGVNQGGQEHYKAID